MGTRVGSGSSVGYPTESAAREATRSAIAKLGSGRPRFGLLFAGPEHDLGVALTAMQEAAGGADGVGCSTAGEFTEDGLTHGGVVAVLIASDDLVHQVAFGSGMKSDPSRVATDLCADFASIKRTASARQRLHSTTVLLTDGLSGMGEKTVEKIFDHTGVFQQIVGGAAGDEGRFEATVVGAGTSTGTDAAAALHVFSSVEWGIGVGHGLQEGLIALTEKDLETPLGTLPNDRALVSELREASGPAAAPDDFAFRGEHSVEFQAVLLRHVLGRSDVPVVPVLCGSFGHLLGRHERAGDIPGLDGFLETLGQRVRSKEGLR